MSTRRTSFGRAPVRRRQGWHLWVVPACVVAALGALILLREPLAERPLPRPRPFARPSRPEPLRAPAVIESAPLSPEPDPDPAPASAVALASASSTPLVAPLGSAVLPPAEAPSSSLPRPSEPVSSSHRVPFKALAAWSQPGLCSSSADGVAVRDTVTANFRVWEPDDGGKFYLDPRLPPGAELPILVDLRKAEAEALLRLGLRSERPLVFVYADQALMKAAACINENVVAFYDGALHVAVNRADVLESVLHEYTHHALFSSGFITPAWAQEGIAMSVARERWWRAPSYLRALLATPFSLEQMDRTIPYKLPAEQAVAFYVQSGALVECLMRAHNWDQRALLTALRAGASADALTYDLPELERQNFLPSCVESLAR
jgi:hypothetical protein